MMPYEYIENIDIPQLCEDIFKSSASKEISYLLVHTHAHFGDLEPSIDFSTPYTNDKKHSGLQHHVYYYRRENLEAIVKDILKSGNLSKTYPLDLKPVFDPSTDIGVLHKDGFLFIAPELIESIEKHGDFGTLFFKNGVHVDVTEEEYPILEKILSEYGRYDILI